MIEIEVGCRLAGGQTALSTGGLVDPLDQVIDLILGEETFGAIRRSDIDDADSVVGVENCHRIAWADREPVAEGQSRTRVEGV